MGGDDENVVTDEIDEAAACLTITENPCSSQKTELNQVIRENGWSKATYCTVAMAGGGFRSTCVLNDKCYMGETRTSKKHAEQSSALTAMGSLAAMGIPLIYNKNDEKDIGDGKLNELVEAEEAEIEEMDEGDVEEEEDEEEEEEEEDAVMPVVSQEKTAKKEQRSRKKKDKNIKGNNEQRFGQIHLY